MTEKRDEALDLLRSLAIIMVVVIHCASAGLVTAPGTGQWYGALLWGALARPAVPVFFMCSGALMLARDVTAKRLLTHNLPRIVASMFFWAFVYHLAALWAGGGLSAANVLDAAKRTVLFQHEFHFYYLHILLLVYAFLPPLRVFVRSACLREQGWLLGVWFAVGIVFPVVQTLWPFTLIPPLSGWWTMPMGFACVGFALLGHVVRQFGSRLSPGWYWGALALGFAVTALGCTVTSLRDGTLNELFLGGTTPGPCLMAAGLFGLATGRKKPLPRAAAAFTGRLARASYCIYLVHVLFQKLLAHVGISAQTPPYFFSIPALAALLLLLGYLAWEVFHRIPAVGRYLT